MLHYDPYERRPGWSGSWRPAPNADAWATAEAVELGDAVEGAYEIETLELDRLVARRDASVSIGGGRRPRGGPGRQDVHARRRPPLADPDRDGRDHQPVGRRRSRRSSGSSGRSRCSAAAATRRPGWRSMASGRRHDAHRTATGQTRLAQGNDYDRHRDHDDDLAGGRGLVRAGRDDLELRGRLRARLPGRGPAPGLAAVTRRRRVADGHRPARGHDHAGPRRRGTRAADRRPQGTAAPPIS